MFKLRLSLNYGLLDVSQLSFANLFYKLLMSLNTFHYKKESNKIDLSNLDRIENATNVATSGATTVTYPNFFRNNMAETRVDFH